MKLLAGTHYDPSTAASVSTASLVAMTAIDTTNLRLTFIAPSTGRVLVRLRGVTTGATTSPSLLLGVLDGATVRGRCAPITGRVNTGANAMLLNHASFTVSGLTPGQSYTWDAAYGVEFAVASSTVKYGGPNNATANDAWGSFAFEIYDTPGCLASTHYDPGTAATASIASLAAMTAFDTTNLRLSFVAPSAGKVLCRVRVTASGSTTLAGTPLLGVLDGATVKGRTRGLGWQGFTDASVLATQFLGSEAYILVTGLTPGTTYNYDAAYGVEATMTGASIGWGGPDDATQANAYGGLGFDIWNTDDLPRSIGQAA